MDSTAGPSDIASPADARSVAELLTVAASGSPDRLALVAADGPAVTWAELDEEVSRVAAGLGRAGIVGGHRVLLACGNRIEFVAGYLGILRAQAVAVPVNPGARAGELARMLADSRARLVITDADAKAAVLGAVDLLSGASAGEGGDELEPDLVRDAVIPAVVVVGEASYAALREEAATVPPAPVRDPEAAACILYTSGTSGRPRGAMLSHRALLANIEQVASVEPPMMHGDDVVLCVLPLFHVYGLNAVLGGALRHRCKLIIARRFDPLETLDLIEDEAVSVVPVAPPVFAYWLPLEGLRDRLGSVRLMLSGSAPLSRELTEKFADVAGVPVHQGYGLTEAAPVVTSTLCSSTVKAGSVGAALPGVELRLVDDRGVAVVGEDAGEIQIRGANLFSGYWPDGANGPDRDGWWATGDVGFLDGDGDLFLVDRLKELVIVSGFNVYPSEVEDVVREVEGVREVAVIGVPDEQTGEAVVAYVVGGDEHLIRAHCEERLARFKQPARIELVDRLPLTVTGKVQKGRLRSVERRRSLGLLE